MKSLKQSSALLILLLILSETATPAEEVPLYYVYELTFKGSEYSIKDNPVRDTELVTTWQHDKGGQTLRIYGFYDGDGKGGNKGNCFKVRFCPVETGIWKLIRVQSNDIKLNGQHLGFQINAISSEHPGFWISDNQSAGRRWYKRSNGDHQYIIGNTMYSFLSEYFDGKPTGGKIKEDIINNGRYFNKVRIGITGDRYPNPFSNPFLDENGKPTDDGNYSHRPNPEWFFNRLDIAVKTGYEYDIIVDLILNGPDTFESRSILKAARNNYDPEPILKYIAARYGSYPNIWICLANEFDIKEPAFKCEEIIRSGKTLQTFLPYETPLSVHSVRHWTEELNSAIPWFDHIIFQTKLKKVDLSADNIQINYILGGARQPVIDDELAYEGDGDGWSEADVIEAFLGAFTGGGYGSTGYKSANKVGHYFSGNFNPAEHKAADNLAWFRKIINENIAFWKMTPVICTSPGEKDRNIFPGSYDSRWRLMAWDGNEYVISGSSPGRTAVLLPEGKWSVISYDLISMKEEILEREASGRFEFSFTNSRALMFHFKRIR